MNTHNRPTISHIPNLTRVVASGNGLRIELRLNGDGNCDDTTLVTRDGKGVKEAAINDATGAGLDKLGLVQAQFVLALEEIAIDGHNIDLSNLQPGRSDARNSIGQALAKEKTSLVIAVPRGMRTLLELDRQANQHDLYVDADATVDIALRSGWSLFTKHGPSYDHCVDIVLLDSTDKSVGRLRQPSPSVYIHHEGSQIVIGSEFGFRTSSGAPLLESFGQLTDASGEEATLDQINASLTGRDSELLPPGW